MNKVRWVRVAAAAAIAVGATLVVTAGPASALPRRCTVLLDAVDYDWGQVNELAAWANVAAHDGDWQDYADYMHQIQYWTMVATESEKKAQAAHCY
jgi:hypothetical protein